MRYIKFLSTLFLIIHYFFNAHSSLPLTDIDNNPHKKIRNNSSFSSFKPDNILAYSASTSIMHLPQDLKISIISLLMPHEAFIISRVSKQFYEIVNSAKLWITWQQRYPVLLSLNYEKTDSAETTNLFNREYIINHCKRIKLAVLYLNDKFDSYKKVAASLSQEIELFPFIKSAIDMATQSSTEHPVFQKLLKVRDKDTLQYFLICHMMGINYKDDQAAWARNFIEDLCVEKNSQGLHAKIEGLLKGFYGYKPDKQEIKSFIEELVKDRHPIGILYKMNSKY